MRSKRALELSFFQLFWNLEAKTQATKIQSAVRGHLTRRGLATMQSRTFGSIGRV